jgi:hypothetical protein
MMARVVNEHGGDQVSDPKTWKRYQFHLDSDTDRAIDEIAAEIADALGQPEPNRSQAVRELVQLAQHFDMREWSTRRRVTCHEPAQAAA